MSQVARRQARRVQETGEVLLAEEGPCEALGISGENLEGVASPAMPS
ncbi:hypothetical protein Spb1_17760 [Planctopirus ephydatiae]|uniref:Uncharacterized protein n=1 Tax=Planctopirus ephydatiae TaxID=2528019 RepID=A0A518GMQ9_9PLAN|nr:hypothetical protein [Planctopirus ephydatiae]QDV29857.1 hypothetical protein Spb1_17760 [Planctopirus ephydatiae]